MREGATLRADAGGYGDVPGALEKLIELVRAKGLHETEHSINMPPVCSLRVRRGPFERTRSPLQKEKTPFERTKGPLRREMPRNRRGKGGELPPPLFVTIKLVY